VQCYIDTREDEADFDSLFLSPSPTHIRTIFNYKFRFRLHLINKLNVPGPASIIILTVISIDCLSCQSLQEIPGAEGTYSIILIIFNCLILVCLEMLGDTEECSQRGNDFVLNTHFRDSELEPAHS